MGVDAWGAAGARMGAGKMMTQGERWSHASLQADPARNRMRWMYGGCSFIQVLTRRAGENGAVSTLCMACPSRRQMTLAVLISDMINTRLYL
jgi:hypothetical protein